ncbi:hypothetical protein REPUB_Repub18cG0104200 [Reevesia pubescens]
MVFDMFSSEEAACILSTPLSTVNAEDRFIWEHTSLGDFTVRSAYVVARAYLNKHVRQPEHRSPVWRAVWQAQVMPKVKFFHWKLIWSILPVASTLRAKGVPIDNRCVVCAGEHETIYHTFFECVLIMVVWHELCSWLVMSHGEWQDLAMFWLQLLMKTSENNQLELVMNTLWLLWGNRNECPQFLYFSTSSSYFFVR